MSAHGAAAERSAPAPFALSEPFEGRGIDPSLLAMTGLEQVRTHIRGEGPAVPISVLFGMRPVEADVGSAVFAMPASGWLLGADGLPQAGVLAPLADAAHSSAIATTFGRGSALATLCLTMSYVARLEAGAEELVCHARVERRGADDVVHSSAEIVDERGSLLAHSTARCSVFPLPGVEGGGEPGDRTGKPLPRGSAADPAPGTEARGEPLPERVWKTSTGADVLGRLCSESAPLPPIHHLTGLRAVAAHDGEVRMSLPATTWISSILRQVQGGALAMLAESAVDAAVLATLDAGGTRETVELRVDFLRKVPAGDEVLDATASLVHRGRNFAFGSCTVSSAERGPVATATSVHRRG
ncbi:MAG: PaaI family thioesterase [Actinomycetota bacterium]|nr:PaaI family thioesterase [Actinomycetota bacterium]